MPLKRIYVEGQIEKGSHKGKPFTAEILAGQGPYKVYNRAGKNATEELMPIVSPMTLEEVKFYIEQEYSVRMRNKITNKLNTFGRRHDFKFEA